MCGIIGLLIKKPALRSELGRWMTPMLIGMTERGPDSAGLAVFSDPLSDEHARKISVYSGLTALGSGFDWQALAAALEAEGMRAVSGGTETHLALMDIRSTGVTGKVADERCGAAGIVMNKNSIPYDPEKPGITSGIRVGSPATTTQGMGVDEMKQIATLISRAIKTDDAATHAAIKSEVHALTARFPIYQA